MIPQKSPSPLDCGSSIMHWQDPQCTCLVLTMMMMVKHSWKISCNFSGISPEPFPSPSLVCQPSGISLPPPAFHHILTWSSLAAAATKLETFEVSLAEVSLRARTDWGRNSFRCCTEAWPGRYWAEYWRTRPAPPFVPLSSSSSSSLLPLPSSSSSSSSLHALNCCSEKFAQYY